MRSESHNGNYVNFCKLLIINDLTKYLIEFLSHFWPKKGGVFPLLVESGYSRKLLFINSLSMVVEDQIWIKNMFRPSSKVDIYRIWPFLSYLRTPKKEWGKGFVKIF